MFIRFTKLTSVNGKNGVVRVINLPLAAQHLSKQVSDNAVVLAG